MISFVLLQTKEKTEQDKEKEDSDYKAWLKGQTEKLDDEETTQKMEGLKSFWSKKDLGEDEKFLKDYILNKRYLDQSDDEEEEDDGEKPYDAKAHDSDSDLSADERTVKEMEDFEHKFNFRFEEPDPEFIKRYPRTIKDSVRTKDSSRKKKREEVKERKEREKQAKRDELKQLKALKRKDIMDKLNKLKKIAGSEELDFENVDLDGDFDPEEYDKKMAKVFENYDATEVENEGEKPEFSDLDSDLENELDTENWDDYAGGEVDGDGGANEEDDDDYENYDDDNLNDKARAQQELIESTIGKRGKRKARKSKFAEAVEKQKPVFNPEDHKTFTKYLDEYYKLDCEDIIGDLPCRFKYRSVPKNDFGLSTNEVLALPDRELNAWSSLKNTCSYRTKEEEERDITVFKQKGSNMHLKKKILPSLFAEDPEEALQAERSKKSEKQKRRRKGKKTEEAEANGEEIADEAPKADGEDAEEKQKAGKKKKRKRKRAEDATGDDATNGQAATEQTTEEPSKSSKKRKRNKGGENGAGNANEIQANKHQGKGSKKVDKSKAINEDMRMSDERMKAYGLNPGSFKRKLKKQKFKEGAANK